MNYDIICVTETWLGEKVLDSILLHETPYLIIRNDRDSKHGGGCCIFIYFHLY